jgi:Methyl-accepting chemotaxis protein (MCP) signalling domain/Cache domain
MSTNLWTKASTLSFKTKTILIAIAVGVIPVATIGLLNYSQASHSSQARTIETQKNRAAAISDKLNRFMFERSGDAAILSSLPIFTNPKVGAITSPEEKTRILDRFVTIYGVYDSIAVFDLNGNPLSQSKGPKLGNHADRKYFQDTLATGKVVISAPSISKTTGIFAIYIAAPVKDLTTGKVTGVIRSRVPITNLQAPISDFNTKSESFHILDRQTNKVFISSNGEYNNKPETPDIALAGTKGVMVNSRSPGANSRAQLLSATPFKKLEGMTELPWMAITTIDETAAYGELQSLILTILAETFVTGGLTVGLSLFFADRVTKYIQKAIATITASANEITDTVQNQEITVNQQANSAIETNDNINILEAISTETAAQADASSTGAQQALSLAEEGTQAVQKTIGEMSELRDRVDEIAQQIVNLGEQTGQITTVSDLVSDLAKQTNMLALKAAVEAARAGEQGKGFGVVAGEIRKLADESKKSAQKINNLAADIQTAINRTVMVTDRGTKTATNGIQLAENTATTFVGVTNAVNNVFLNSQQISSSTKRQSTAIQQVLGAMNNIAQGSQESAIGMHKVKTSTNELTMIADELQAVVS